MGPGWRGSTEALSWNGGGWGDTGQEAQGRSLGTVVCRKVNSNKLTSLKQEKLMEDPEGLAIQGGTGLEQRVQQEQERQGPGRKD